MPLSQSDIQFRYSNVTATGANNDSASPPTSNLATNCIGKWISTIAWGGGIPNDLFSDITGAENIGNAVDYRCVFVVNLNPSLTLYNAIVYIPTQTVGGAIASISLEYAVVGGNVRVSPVTSGTQQAIALPSATATPSDLANGWTTAFSTANGSGNALNIGDIPPQQCCPIWVKRQATNSPAVNSDGFSIRVEGDSPQ